MRRAVHVAWVHLRVTVMNELQYRANFFIQLLQSLIAVGTGLVVLALIFDRTPDLNGWTRPQLLAVLGVYSIVGGVIGFAIQPAMDMLMADVHQGRFDHVLTKPADSQLLTGVRNFRLWRLTDVLVGVAVVVWALVELHGNFGVLDIVSFVVMLTAGCGVLYCLWLLVTCGVFWVTRIDMVQDLFTGFYRAGQYPTSAYPTGLRLTLTYLIPIGLAVTTPSEALTGRLSWGRFAVLLVFVAAVFVFTRLVWRVGTRRYAGASA